MKADGPMLQIRNQRVVQLAEKLAAIRRSTKTEAVRQALENELARIEGAQTLEERLRPIQDRIARRPATGLEADKAFYDDLNGEDELSGEA
jgi:antitoxin VapB